MSRKDRALLKRFGGEEDRYGLGMVIIDCSVENLTALLEAVREEERDNARLDRHGESLGR